MNQAEVTRLVSKLRFKIQPRHRNMRTPRGPEGRLDTIAQTVTGLIKYERLELNHIRADETRGYAERLISDAIRYGDTHAPTMEMANFFIKEKQYIHKLFKVLVPRFQNFPLSYTRMYKRSPEYTGHNPHGRPRAVLELRGHPFPPLKPDMSMNRNLIHNVLLSQAKKEYRREKYEKLAADGNNEGKLDQNDVEEIIEQFEKAKVDDSTERKE